MRARGSRLADRLMFVVSVTTNLSQRIAGRLVQLPAPVTFILSQLGGHGQYPEDVNPKCIFLTTCSSWTSFLPVSASATSSRASLDQVRSSGETSLSAQVLGHQSQAHRRKRRGIEKRTS